MRIIRIIVKRDDCPKTATSDGESKKDLLSILFGPKETAVMYGKKVRKV